MTETKNIPATQLGKSLLRIADSLNTKANQETILTHGQMWGMVCAEAVLGGLCISAIGTGQESKVIPIDALSNLLDKVGYSREVYYDIGTSDPNWSFMPQAPSIHDPCIKSMPLKQFAYDVIGGALKSEDGEQFFPLNKTQTASVIGLLNTLHGLEKFKCFASQFCYFIAIATLARSAIMEKAHQKVKYSENIGRIPAILPAISQSIRKIGNLL